MNPIEEIKQKIDIVDLISEYLPLKKVGKNYRALCPFHKEKNPSFYVSPERQIWHCFGCFLPGTLIKTEKGFHKIEELKIGDKVLTHRGRYMPVIRTLWRPYKGEIVEIKVRKSNEIISLTSDHRVYVIKTKNCIYKNRTTRICQWRCDKKGCPRFYLNYKIEKVPASQLSLNDFLLYPVNREIKDVEIIDLEKYYHRKESNFGVKIGEIPTKIKVDEKFLKLLGYYIAEGSNHRAYIRFSLGGDEIEFAKEIIKLIKEIFGIKGSIHERKKGKTGIEVTACNSKLADIFGNLCGKGAENKHIPFELQFLPPEKQRIILDAIWKGDGTISKVRGCKEERTYKSIGTTSLILAEQLRDILLRLKIAPSISIREEKIDKKGVHHKKHFVVSWQEEYKLNFTHFYEKDGVLYWLLPIKEIRKRYYQGDTYDLTVAEDHSYVATNFVVSNCGRGGDIFRFVMEIENVDFPEALRILAKKAGVELKEYEKVDFSKKNLLRKINEEAAKFFERNLWKNQEALDYLLKRGLKKETIKEFQLGFAEDDWHLLERYLKEKGFLQTDIFEAGLLVKTEDGRFYDRFRSRIIFPLFDPLGSIIGFSGRIFKKETDAGKYINTPQTLIFDKSQLLYGIHKSKEFIRKENKALIVEGQMDFLMAWQSGLKYAVAVSGTAFTEKQLNILKRYTQNLILCFDMDEAGQAACERSIFEAKKRDFSIEVLPLTFGKDLAELFKEKPEEAESLLSKKVPIMEFFFEKAKKIASPLEAEGKKKIAHYFLGKVKSLVSPIEQAFWVEKLANFLKIKEEPLYEALKSIKISKEREEEEKIETLLPKEVSLSQTLSKKILALILKEGKEFLENVEIEDLKKYLDEDYKEIFLKLLEGKEKEIEEDIAYLNLFYEYQYGDLEIDRKKELKKLIKLLKKEALKSEIEKLNFEIKEAEKAGDQKKVEALLSKIKELSEKLKEYQ